MFWSTSVVLYDGLQVHNQHQYRRQQGNEWFRWGGNASASIAAGSQSGVAASGAPPAGSRWIDPSSYTIPSPPRQGGCSAAHISTIHTLCIKVSYTIVYNPKPTKAGEESTLHNMQTICSEPVWQLMSFILFAIQWEISATLLCLNLVICLIKYSYRFKIIYHNCIQQDGSEYRFVEYRLVYY